MSFSFKFPDIGEGITEGTIIEWYVEVGQEVKANQPVLKVETDKVVDDIPSPRTGKIIARYGEPQQEIKVGDVLIEIQVEGEPQANSSSEEEHQESVGVVGTLEVAKESDVLPSSDEGTGTRSVAVSTNKKSLATPAARAYARNKGIDINTVTGTGPAGRVTKADIDNYQGVTSTTTSQPTPPPIKVSKSESHEIVPLSQIRKTIAKRMVLSKQTAPHMTVLEEVEVSSLVALRSAQKEKFAARGAKLTYLPFILKAVVTALKEHKVLNSQLDLENNRIIYKKDYNIGIAVDAPDGLVVPVIHSADRMSIFELSQTIESLAQKARDRQLSMDNLKGGTFSLTNFGAIAGIYGIPIINYPEVAILGLGRIQKIPVIKNDEIQKGQVLPLSLSVDHRIVDGGDATRFLRMVMELLADPMELLLM